jgi:hypothetical protein
MNRSRWLAALLVGIAAFALYRATLLPGFDFGDTGSFQAMAGSALITPRDGYPLYFAIGDAVLRIVGGDPAHALNLASAIEAEVACGLIVVGAAVATALFFAASYTFWSQAVIAEVYSLHIALLALTLLLLLHWAAAPTVGRLTAFFAVYALGFGNHLSMILLLPGYTLFLLLAAPDGWRSMFRPRIIAVAAACAAAGALQYAWNLSTLWQLPDPPHGAIDALQRFWFDVTKSDWRETMVMNVPQSLLRDHLAMYWFELREQFGIAGPLLAVAGVVQLALANPRRAWLMFTLFAANLVFAFSYNVGDAHVFYLPSHVLIALLAAPGIMLIGRLGPLAAPVAAALLTLYAGSRAWHDFPALDRSRDTRPEAVIDALTVDLDDRHEILLEDVNWQIGNGLAYFAKVKRPEIAYARMPDVALYAPALVADNRAVGRRVALTERARATLDTAYGPLLPVARDPRVESPTLAEVVRAVPAGTRYALCVLRPSRDLAVDIADLAETIRVLTGHAVMLPAGDYAVVAGTAGRVPDVLIAENEPFQRELPIEGTHVEIRMDAWLAFDTIRRMGFGHIVAAHRHTLIVERGISFVAFDSQGVPIRTAYRSNIFAPQARYLIDTNTK